MITWAMPQNRYSEYIAVARPNCLIRVAPDGDLQRQSRGLNFMALFCTEFAQNDLASQGRRGVPQLARQDGLDVGLFTSQG